MADTTKVPLWPYDPPPSWTCMFIRGQGVFSFEGVLYPQQILLNKKYPFGGRRGSEFLPHFYLFCDVFSSLFPISGPPFHPNAATGLEHDSAPNCKKNYRIMHHAYNEKIYFWILNLNHTSAANSGKSIKLSPFLSALFNNISASSGCNPNLLELSRRALFNLLFYLLIINIY